jgi:hypothetical protein
MRPVVLMALFAICPIALAQGKHDYSGVWKKNCEDEMGLHIKPLRDRPLYTVLFCKNDICSEPGAYRPNTRIDGDPLYEVLNAKTMKVRYSDGGFALYKRCGDVPPPK